LYMSERGLSLPSIYYIYVRYKASRDTNISAFFKKYVDLWVFIFSWMWHWPNSTVSHPRRICMFSNTAVRTSNLTCGLILMTFLRHMTRFHSKTKLKTVLHLSVHIYLSCAVILFDCVL
jgi:hypothetical protein